LLKIGGRGKAEEVRNYCLIDGFFGELEILDKKLKGENSFWRRD